MRTREHWDVLIHQKSPFAENRVIHPEELVGTPVVTIHVNTPTHQEVIRWSGEYAKLMDFSINYDVLYNAVIAAREQLCGLDTGKGSHDPEAPGTAE